MKYIRISNLKNQHLSLNVLLPNATWENCTLFSFIYFLCQEDYSKEFPKQMAESTAGMGWDWEPETLSVMAEKEARKAESGQAAYLDNIKW